MLHWCPQERPQPSHHHLRCKQQLAQPEGWQRVQQQQRVLLHLLQQQGLGPLARPALVVLLQQLAPQMVARGRPRRCLLQCRHRWQGQQARQVPHLLLQHRRQ